MVAAVEATRQRALRASQALTQAGIPFVVVGGHAVAAWVARVDLEAVRNTKDVDLLIQRNDLPGVIIALSQVGFVYQQVNGVELFLDGEQGSDRSGIHLVFAGEKVRPDYVLPTPTLAQAERMAEFTRAEVQRYLRDDAPAVAIGILVEVGTDRAQPGGTRVRAAEKLGMLSDIGLTDAQATKDPSEMNGTEIAQMLAKLERQQHALMTVAADRARDVTPDSGGVFE